MMWFSTLFEHWLQRKWKIVLFSTLTNAILDIMHACILGEKYSPYSPSLNSKYLPLSLLEFTFGQCSCFGKDLMLNLITFQRLLCPLNEVVSLSSSTAFLVLIFYSTTKTFQANCSHPGRYNTQHIQISDWGKLLHGGVQWLLCSGILSTNSVFIWLELEPLVFM